MRLFISPNHLVNGVTVLLSFFSFFFVAYFVFFFVLSSSSSSHGRFAMNCLHLAQRPFDGGSFILTWIE